MPLIYSIEDDDGILELISCSVKMANMTFQGFESYAEFEKAIQKELPDLILLDIMLPGIDGFGILKLLKENSKFKKIPVIMLSAKDRENDKVSAFEFGAEDYISKPFGVFELVARIKAVLKRNQVNTSDKNTPTIISASGIILDTEKHSVKLHNNGKNSIIELTNKEFMLLKTLMSNLNIVLTRDRLLETVWGYDFLGETRTVDVHIMSLRQKLSHEGENSSIISTVRGVGYKFVCEE